MLRHLIRMRHLFLRHTCRGWCVRNGWTSCGTWKSCATVGHGGECAAGEAVGTRVACVYGVADVVGVTA